MNNAIYNFSYPANEPINEYKACSADRNALIEAIKHFKETVYEIPIIINGKEIYSKDKGEVRIPHNHQHLLAKYSKAGEKDVTKAIESAKEAHKKWEKTSWVERVSITLKIAELISKKYRHLLNAATMLGQSKTAYQAEIDAVCETIDFIKFNAYYVSQIYNQQPHSESGILNRIEYRPLEGFVFSVSPFNFTSISSNLNLSAVLLGNTVVWKPSSTSLLSNYILMKIFQEAGLPDGVINFVPGDGKTVGNIALNHPDLAGVHFTGSTNTFNQIWKTVANNIGKYRSYPKLVGETGGKDFIFVHKSANINEVATAIVRGAFEYQGQKCSAASRAYIPKSLWSELNHKISQMITELKVGVVEDFETFMSAVIDKKAFDRISAYINKAQNSNDAEILYGGNYDDSKGYYIDPTIILTTDPHFITMEEEIFGPVMTIYVYEDEDFELTLELCDNTSPYALTGAIFSTDREALNFACSKLKYASGNLYLNDKPTGAVVGQQPFGGSRASGTNDKAGSSLNLLRWTNPRTIKENLVPPTDFKYSFMKKGKCD